MSLFSLLVLFLPVCLVSGTLPGQKKIEEENGLPVFDFTMENAKEIQI